MTLCTKCGIMEKPKEVDMTRRAELTAEFVSDVVTAVELDPDTVGFPYQYDSQTCVLWIQFSRAYTWWLQDRRAANQASLQQSQLKAEFRARSIYLAGEDLYVVGPTRRAFLGTTKWMHGLDLAACFEAGIDIPDSLDRLVPFGYKVYSHDSEGVVLDEATPDEEGEELAGFVTTMEG